jgi:hypothetical protein
MDEVKATPVQSQRLLKLAQLMRKGKDFANKAQIPDVVPLVGGQGVGDMLLGDSPDEVENWAYGSSPVRINANAGQTASFVPEVQPNRKKSLADALALVPFSGGGGASQAMITAAGDPRYVLSRATYTHALSNAIRGKGSSSRNAQLLHPSFGINKDKVMDEAFGDHFILPHPRAVDPKYNPQNDLFNLDAYTGYLEPGRKDTRLLFEDPPDKDYAARIATSPRFNSFKDYESSPAGARLLRAYDDPPFLKSDPRTQRVLDSLDKYVPDWYENIGSGAKPFGQLKESSPVEFERIKKLVSMMRKNSSIGQDHAELKVQGTLPLSGDSIQAVLVPTTAVPWGSPISPAEMKTLRSRGIKTQYYEDLNEANEIAKRLQQEAKF